MRDHALLLFILALPALAVLGHDGYMAYNNTEYELAERFYLSDLGWLWTKYSPDSFEWAKFAFEETTWTQFVDPILEQKAFYIASIAVGIALLTLLVMRIFGVGAYQGQGLSTMFAGRKKSGDSFSFRDGSEPKKRAKYKRK